MINIDMHTALLIYTFCFVVGVLFTTYYYIVVENNRKELIYIVAFNVLALIGSLLILFREDLSVFVSVIISNSLLFFAYVSLSIGVRKLVGLPPKVRNYIGVFVLYILLFVYYTYFDFQVMYRVHIYNAAVLLVIGFTIISILRVDMKGKELMTYVLLFLGLSIIVRSVNLIINAESAIHFLGFEYDPFFILIMGIANILILSGVLSLIDYHRVLDLTESERSKTSLLSNLPGFAYRCLNDESWTMEFLSDGFFDVTGYEKEDVLNNQVLSFEDLISTEFKEIVRETWNAVIKNHDRYMAEYKIINKDKEEIWILEQGVGIYDENNQCVAIEGFITDVNTRKNMEKNLEFLSYRDYLTGLYNKRYIEEQVLRLQKSRNVPISIIMGDINGLKFVNDSFGHDHGDELIQVVANILTSALRDHELIARIGGDEFLIILENTSNDDTKAILGRIQEQVQGNKYSNMGLSISFGYATKTNMDEKLKDVIKDAEDRMYKEKLYNKPSSRRKAVDAVLSTLFEKDKESEIHSRNVSKYSKMLAKEAGLSPSKIKKTETAGLLHDVGKIIIDTSILKSSKILSDKEFEEMRNHSQIGYRILHNVKELEDIANIILSHHERIDGSGYPNGLKDKDIPYISKIISICDAYEAMTNKRRYKDKLKPEEAFKELKRHSGTQFDEKLVDLFIEMIKNEKKN